MGAQQQSFALHVNCPQLHAQLQVTIEAETWLLLVGGVCWCLATVALWCFPSLTNTGPWNKDKCQWLLE